MKLTQEQLAKRREGMAQRAAARAAWEAERKQDEATVLEVLRAILTDPAATADQRVFAVCVLNRMQHYGFVPYDAIPGRKDGEIIADFARMLKDSDT